MNAKEEALEQATGILGEHYRNYVVIVQDEDFPTFFDCVYSDPFATYGLILEASKYHATQMAALCALEYEQEEEQEEPQGPPEQQEWIWEDEEPDEEDPSDD